MEVKCFPKSRCTLDCIQPSRKTNSAFTQQLYSHVKRHTACSDRATNPNSNKSKQQTANIAFAISWGTTVGMRTPGLSSPTKSLGLDWCAYSANPSPSSELLYHSFKQDSRLWKLELNWKQVYKTKQERLKRKWSVGFSCLLELQAQLNILMLYAFAKKRKLFTQPFLSASLNPSQFKGQVLFKTSNLRSFFCPPLPQSLNESHLQSETWCSQMRSSPHTKAHHFKAKISITIRSALQHPELRWDLLSPSACRFLCFYGISFQGIFH